MCIRDRQNIDRLCFSTQFFFVVTLNLCGQSFLLVGLQILVMNIPYNAFADGASLIIFPFTLLLCYLLHRFILKLGRFLRIWRIRRSSAHTQLITEMRTTEAEEKDASKIEVAVDFNDFAKPEIAPLTAKANRLEAFVAREDRIAVYRSNFETKLFANPGFRRHFMKENMQWIKENLPLVFSPRTTKIHRPKIIARFKRLTGGVPADDSVEESHEERDRAMHGMEKATARRRLRPSFPFVMTVWLYRARFIRIIRGQVSGIMELLTSPRCEFCGCSWTLRTELVQSIENLFKKFIQDVPDQSLSAWDIPKWQEYFDRNAILRTLCFECSEDLLYAHERGETLKFVSQTRPWRERLGVMGRLVGRTSTVVEENESEKSQSD
eukprot:TRINITY_DN11081_c0_g1_i1.p1 TRINITY_DN11081_c0_g1~~TRINITY_DN11081_c0_g1_i1.p1  ORF type:complete len:400 (-),score=86.45 TRINITY_DN11081_c0_g1_i1:95-1234(-)